MDAYIDRLRQTYGKPNGNRPPGKVPLMDALRNQLREEDICPSCQSADLVTDASAGDLICRDCGLVVKDHLFETVRGIIEEKKKVSILKEKQEQDLNAKRKRLVRRVEYVRACKAQHKPIGEELRRTILLECVAMNVERQCADRPKAVTGNERIIQIGDMMKMPEKAKLMAIEMFSEFMAKRGSLIKFVMDKLVVTLLYKAGVHTEFKPLSEFVRVTGVPEKEIRKYWKLLANVVPNTGTTPTQLALRISLQLKLPPRVESKALTIATKAASEMAGKAATALAKAAVLMAVNMHAVQRCEKEIAHAAQVSVTTLRKTYKLMLDIQHILLPR